ncbi:30S ribosomal protein S15 [bacterium]|nr:30S ribosomal protein S15 [bacterium]
MEKEKVTKKVADKDFKKHKNDTGSVSVQIQQLTENITSLTEHLKTHKKDFSGRRGLLKMVGKRRRLLDYLAKRKPEEYQAVLKQFGLKR